MTPGAPALTRPRRPLVGIPRGQALGAIDPAVLDALDEDVCRVFRVLPVAERQGVVQLAIADPSDRAAIRVARRSLRRRRQADARFVVVRQADLDAAIDHHLGAASGVQVTTEPRGPQAGPPLTLRDRLAPPPPPARRERHAAPGKRADAETRLDRLRAYRHELSELLVPPRPAARPSAPPPRPSAPPARPSAPPPVSRRVPAPPPLPGVAPPFSSAVAPPRPPAGPTPPAPGTPPSTPAQAPPAPIARPAPVDNRIGAVALRAGLVTRAEIDAAVAQQERSGGMLGEILTNSGAVDEESLARLLAHEFDLPYLDLRSALPDPEAVAIMPERVAVHHRIAPVTVEDGHLVVAMFDPRDNDALSAIAEHADLPVRKAMASQSSIVGFLQHAFQERHSREAVTGLLRRFPENSAHRVLTRPQKAFFGVLAVVGLIGLAFWPITTVVVFNVASVLFYGAFAVYRFVLVYKSLGHHLELPVSDEEVEALDEHTLPPYTVLVPLYREAAVVPHLTASIEALEYPLHKLDVKLICEADDDQTIGAIRAMRLPPHFELVVVPDAEPKTKPKACNYALGQARGEYVVIFDAEDRPEPDQLKKAVIAFRKSPPTLVCIQCKLNYYNADQNILTRWFTTEYSMWFDLFMPGLDASDSPIPLGGTSNHLKRDVLSELGAWDPFNVAEDADLGIRLAKAGYRTAIIDSTTFEEANSDLQNWIRQRSRWVKGYIQTWLVHMRHPIELARQLGLRRWWSFQLVIGGTFIGFLLNPIYWALTTTWILTEAGVIRALFPSFVYYAAAFGLHVGNFIFLYLNAAGSSRRGYHDLVKYALFSPLYWALMSIGAWKGFLQLFYRPFYWEKTVHGLHESATTAEGAPGRAFPG